MPAGLSHKMVITEEESSPIGDVGRHLLCRGSG